MFKFVELHEKIGFPDAVRLLAQSSAWPLPERSDGDEEATPRRGEREALLKVHEVAAAWFREQLARRPARAARQQLADRGVTPETIEQLGLGFAPPSRDGLKTRLLKQGFAQAVLLQSGLLVQRDDGEVVDRFRNRLMIPICRDTGSVIAFGGRAMDAGPAARST